MKVSNRVISIILVISAIFSFFLGFSMNEISMGAGGFNGDFKFVKKSIALFSQNSILESIKLFSETSNRPPLIYILHKILNPFFTDELGFRKSVFIISLLIPILFFLCLKEKFHETDKNLLFLLSSVIFFNPFFRTSSFWGLEENYAILTSLASILFLLKVLNYKNENSWLLTFYIFLTCLFSSLSIYFDQKFLIIPLICFIRIILGYHSYSSKIFCVFIYTIFSIPYLLLIKLWGGIFPSNIYHIGNQFYFHHLGYALTIIAFIFFPFIFLKSENIKDQISNFTKNNNLYILFLIIIVYLIILIFFIDDGFFENKLDGGGIVKKISLFLFSSLLSKKIFIFCAILISWFFIMFFIEKSKLNFFLTLYFILISVIILPFYQEYFDPIIFILLFFVYNFKFKLDYKKVYFLYTYYLFFLIGTHLYYN